ncbi:MAG: YegP family protein [Oscillospiraceae bacterium]|nr:YegP family protein [Oscillospiraceae bacterium]
MENAKFIFKTTASGEFHFNFLNGENKILGTSENYKTKSNMERGIESVRKNSEIASLEDQTIEGFSAQVNPKFELYIDKANEYRFRLKAKNGAIILASTKFDSKENCMNAIKFIKESALNADLEQEKPALKS